MEKHTSKRGDGYADGKMVLYTYAKLNTFKR
jgi:hypothetical protein